MRLGAGEALRVRDRATIVGRHIYGARGDAYADAQARRRPAPELPHALSSRTHHPPRPTCSSLPCGSHQLLLLRPRAAWLDASLYGFLLGRGGRLPCAAAVQSKCRRQPAWVKCTEPGARGGCAGGETAPVAEHRCVTAAGGGTGARWVGRHLRQVRGDARCGTTRNASSLLRRTCGGAQNASPCRGPPQYHGATLLPPFVKLSCKAAVFHRHRR